MEVKPGYKQTEVGVIPEDWEVKNLRALADYTNGKAHEQNITDSGRFVVVNSKFISSEGVTRKYSDQCFCPTSKGDVLTVMSDVPNGRAIAKCYMVESDETYTVNQRICILRPHSINAKLLFYKLDRNRFYLAFDDGAQQTNLRKHDVLSCPLGIPKSEDEQRDIVAALGDADALVARLDQLIAKKRDLKQAAMQQLLTGQTRLPGFHGEWEMKTVAELEKLRLVKLSRGQVISKKDIDNTPGDCPIYSSSVHNDGLFGRYGKFMFDEELITWSVDGGGHFFHRRKHKFSVTNVCGFMRVDTTRISYRFFAAELQLLHSRKSFDYQSKAHPSVVRKEYEVQLPSLPEQTAIAEVLTDMDAELTALEQRREKTRALKQGMMQELLTGKTRLV
jgi:type I restriction enzyme S subunit